MVKLLIVFGLFFAIVAILLVNFYLCESLDYHKSWCLKAKQYEFSTKLDRKTIKQLYTVSPNKWFVDSRDLLFYKPNHYTMIAIYTNYFDRLWFLYELKKYKRQKRKKEELKKSSEVMQMIINSAQKDIDKLKVQAMQEIENGRLETEKVVKNMKSQGVNYEYFY